MWWSLANPPRRYPSRVLRERKPLDVRVGGVCLRNVWAIGQLGSSIIKQVIKVAYSVEIEGFEGQNIDVTPPSFFAGAKLFVNGEPASRGPKRRQMILRKNDGTEVIATWEYNPMWLNPPILIVGKKRINIIEPLQWYDWMWVGGLPLLIIIIGGNIGVLLGIIGFHANTKIFYSEVSILKKYVSAAGISIALAVIYFAIMQQIPNSLIWLFGG